MRDEVTGSKTAFPERYLQSGNDVLRSAAIRALPAFIEDPEVLRAQLGDALLDPDPDVRSDAMEAFANIADHTDAPFLRRSLEGDPVLEVKLAAIDGLTRLKDRNAVELLRALVLSPDEDRVAWEDEASDWEDWLDVQVAAIRALGYLNVAEAIDDMMAARDDEFGQTLDNPVFDALAQMGETGVDWLLAIVKTEGGLAGQRAMDVLTRMSPDTFAGYPDILLEAQDARIRALATRVLPPDHPSLEVMVLTDPDEEVRIAALTHAAVLRPDLPQRALADRAPRVQAAALDLLTPPEDEGLRTAIADNMLAWLKQAPPVLMRAAAKRLPDIAPDRSKDALLTLIADTSSPLDARVAAAHALGRLEPPVPADTLRPLLANPAKQVRARILALIEHRALVGDPAAEEMMVKAIAGTLLCESESVFPDRPAEGVHDVAAPKDEENGPRRIYISADGDILDADEKDHSSPSTLSAIIDGSYPELAEDTPEETVPKRFKRRAVEGPDQIAKALSLEAIQRTERFGPPKILEALLDQAVAGSDDVRRAAWQALARFGNAPTGLHAAAAKAWRDTDPVIRLAAFTVLQNNGVKETIL